VKKILSKKKLLRKFKLIGPLAKKKSFKAARKDLALIAENKLQLSRGLKLSSQ